MKRAWYDALPRLNSAKFAYENSIRACMIPLTEVIEHGHFDQYEPEHLCVVKIRDHLSFVGYTLSAPIRINEGRMKWIGIMVEQEDGAQYWFHLDASHAVAFKRAARPLPSNEQAEA